MVGVGVVAALGIDGTGTLGSGGSSFAGGTFGSAVAGGVEGIEVGIATTGPRGAIVGGA
jgi:hypothetical protein